MKFFIIIILFLVSSCSSTKYYRDNIKDLKAELKDIKENCKDSIQIDSTFISCEDYKDSIEYMIKSNRKDKRREIFFPKKRDKVSEYQPDHYKTDTTQDVEYVDNVEYIEINKDRRIDYIDRVVIKNNNKNVKISDNTNNKVDNSSEGTIAYSVPEKMKVGESYQIKLRITKEKGKEVNRTLVIGDRHIPISDTTIMSKVVIENIRVERKMRAELICQDNAFKITPLNTEKQIIEDGEYTEWGWTVTPLKSGKAYLKLLIKVEVEVDGEKYTKDIVVFDKNIEVKSNVKLEVKSWFSQYWQWLMTTIIIPLVIFFYKKRKEKKQS